jgi:hypothetical protein
MKKYIFSIFLLLMATSCQHIYRFKEADTLLFTHAPFVNPAIIKDLTISLADNEEAVTSINLESNNSNRYSCDISLTHHDDHAYPVVSMLKDRESFSYNLIGKTPDDINILITRDSGGSGVYTELMLVKIETDNFLKWYNNALCLSTRNIIKRIGSIELGDRYDGFIQLIGNDLHIGHDINGISGIASSDLVIKINGEGL